MPRRFLIPAVLVSVPLGALLFASFLDLGGPTRWAYDAVEDGMDFSQVEQVLGHFARNDKTRTRMFVYRFADGEVSIQFKSGLDRPWTDKRLELGPPITRLGRFWWWGGARPRAIGRRAATCKEPAGENGRSFSCRRLWVTNGENLDAAQRTERIVIRTVSPKTSFVAST